jgi:hypothetical protein
MIEGLRHITRVVSDLDVTEEMQKTVFDAKSLYDISDRLQHILSLGP